MALLIIMMRRLIAGLGLCAALAGGCAHQLTNEQVAVGVVAAVAVVGIAVVNGEETNCELRDRCRPPDPMVSAPPTLDAASRSAAVHTVVGPGAR